MSEIKDRLSPSDTLPAPPFSKEKRYESPRIEGVFTSDDLRREIQYAGFEVLTDFV